jgi:hypothetical protein
MDRLCTQSPIKGELFVQNVDPIAGRRRRALDFLDGEYAMLAMLEEGQSATVLQLPASALRRTPRSPHFQMISR